MGNFDKVKLFYESISKDKNLYQKFIEICSEYEGQKLDTEEKEKIIQEKIIPLAKSNGYEFTFEEFKEYEKELSTLNDSDLDNTAGGVIGACVGYGIGCSPVFNSSIKDGVDYSLEHGPGLLACIMLGIGGGHIKTKGKSPVGTFYGALPGGSRPSGESACIVLGV